MAQRQPLPSARRPAHRRQAAMSLFSWRFLPIASKAARAIPASPCQPGKMTQRSGWVRRRAAANMSVLLFGFGNQGPVGARTSRFLRPAVMIDRGSRIDVALPGQSASLPSDFVLPLRGNHNGARRTHKHPHRRVPKSGNGFPAHALARRRELWGRRAG